MRTLPRPTRLLALALAGSLAAMLAACGGAEPEAGEVPHSSRDQFAQHLEELDETLDRLEEGAEGDVARRIALLEERHEDLRGRLDELEEADADDLTEREQERDLFEQELLQLEADVLGLETDLQTAARRGDPAQRTGG